MSSNMFLLSDLQMNLSTGYMVPFFGGAFSVHIQYSAMVHLKDHIFNIGCCAILYFRSHVHDLLLVYFSDAILFHCRNSI